MIEAAYTDGEVDESELNKIKFSLINILMKIQMLIYFRNAIKKKQLKLHHYNFY